MANTQFEGFSLSHAAILDGSTGAEEVDGDIYGVRTASVVPDSGNYDNTGDDVVRSSWYWLNYATVTVESGYVPFSLIALMSGSTLTSSGAAPNDYYSLPLWETASLNVAPKPMLIRVPSRDSDGVPRTIDFVLYKVQFSPITFTGPAYKAGLLTSYAGRALPSLKDEKGNTIAKEAVGRLVNTPD